ncbi:MAG: hypothetical protein QOI03_237 [Solirubrobacteraceae bacterium]|nr:hypothetical protein [Solirubrobacteraceae bacterium]
MNSVSALIPSGVLRSIDRVRTRRFLATVGPPTVEYVRRSGLAVRGGPFAGMRYIEGLERSSGDLVAKLAGTYERELHRVFSEWIDAEHPHVVDVGCAEGYYAVGFAHAMSQTTVHAYDIDAVARARCAELAQLNGVADRVRILGACEPSALNAFPEQGVALLCDCEGYERILLDPVAAPRLAGWPLLVELHDFIDASITETIRRRFQASHEIEIIEGEGREQDAQLPELAFMSSRARAAVLGEHRPGPMRWAHMRPR